MGKINITYIAFVIWCLILIVGLTLGLRYRWFLKQVSEEEKNKSYKPIMKETPSYEMYRKISSRRGVRCGVIRENGDFLDFLLSYHNRISEHDNLESQLAGVDVGETL